MIHRVVFGVLAYWLITCLLSSLLQAYWMWVKLDQSEVFVVEFIDYIIFTGVVLVMMVLITLLPFLTILYFLLKNNKLGAFITYVLASIITSIFAIIEMKYTLVDVLIMNNIFFYGILPLGLYMSHLDKRGNQIIDDSDILDD